MARIVRILIASGLFAAALAAQTHSATITWPPNTTGDPVTTYNVLRGTTSGGESSTPLAAVAASTCTTVCTYVDTTVVGGSTYFYEISATNSGGTSAPGGETSTTIPFFVPAIPAKPTVVGK